MWYCDPYSVNGALHIKADIGYCCILSPRQLPSIAVAISLPHFYVYYVVNFIHVWKDDSPRSTRRALRAAGKLPPPYPETYISL